MKSSTSEQTPSKCRKETRKTRTSVKCDICDKILANKKTLSSHILTHTGEKPHECTQCGHRFALKGTLSSHIA